MMMEWKPIETAPKDGTCFLAWYGGQVRFMQWGKTSHVPLYGFVNIDEGPENCDICKPTHWQPLPAPPEEMATGCAPHLSVGGDGD